MPRDEQRLLWRLQGKHHRQIVVKPRKTGISTACTLPEVLEAGAADEAGETVLYVCAIDTDEKASTQATAAIDFAQQLELKIRTHANGLTFPGSGSELRYVTAGGKMAGRGSTIHRLRCTELPYWREPQASYQSLRSACADTTPITVETTTEIDRDGYMRALWRGQLRDPVTGRVIAVGPEFHRHFFSVESHAPYRADPATISDEEWEMCRSVHGFTDRAAAAWWLRHALVNLAAGDEQRLLHDYPQAEWHLFAATSGRVISVTPAIAEVVERVPVLGLGGQQHLLEVYIRPEECSGSVIIAVDTAYGVNKTRSVVLVVDTATAKVCAAFCSATVLFDDLARVTAQAWHTYRDRMPHQLNMQQRVHVVIESNGIGLETSREATKVGVPHAQMDQLKNLHTWGADACIKQAKRQIEAGLVAGPPELAEECDSLTKRDGRYSGLKDILMTYGMALIKRVELGVRDDRWKTTRKDPNRIYVEDRLNEERRRDRLERGLRR